MRRILRGLALFVCMPIGSVFADGRVTYLANAAALVEHAETKVLFDPLFDNGFDRYDLVPDDMLTKLYRGEPPFDGVDAVFVSHAHSDHFAADRLLRYLREQPDVRVYAPMQAVIQMREDAAADDSLFSRVVGIAAELDEPAADYTIGEVEIRVARVPHSGWPDRMTDIENLVFHVRLEGETSVTHFGDADPNPEHFAPHAGVWHEFGADLALPPWWFFLSDGGLRILEDHVVPTQTIGVHVPADMPDNEADRPDDVRGYDLFTTPGEQRSIP